MTKILKINLDNVGQSFELRFIPNAKDLKTRILSRNLLIDKAIPGTRRAQYITRYYSYVYHNNEIHILMYGYQIHKYICACMHGFYGTKEGHLLFTEMPENDEDDCAYNYKYYAKTNSNDYIYGETIEEIMNFDYKDSINYYDKDPFLGIEKIIHEIVKYEPFLPFHFLEEKCIAFDVNEQSGFMKIDNLHLVSKELLFKEGDDENKVLALYDNVQTLEDYAKEYSKINNFVYEEDKIKETEIADDNHFFS